MKNPTRVICAVPVGKLALAGKLYSAKSGNPADDLSFTRGFFPGGDATKAEWAVACWLVPATEAAWFQNFITQYPTAKVQSWPDDPSVDPAAVLSAAGLKRPARDVLGNLV